LVELERRLSGRIPAERLFTVTSEVEDHLSLKCDDLVASGMGDAQAQRSAVESFGSADAVADEVLVGGSSTASRRMGGILVIVATACIFAMLAVVAYTGLPYNGLATMAVDAGLLGVFCYGSALARQPLRRSIALIAIPGTVIVTLLFPHGFTMERGTPIARNRLAFSVMMNSNTLDRWLVSVDRLDVGLKFYRELEAAKGDLSKVKSKPLTDASGAYIKLPEYWGYDPRQLGLNPPDDRGMENVYGWRQMNSYERTTNLAEAEQDWIRRGPGMLASTRSAVSGTRRALAYMRAAQRGDYESPAARLAYAAGTGLSAVVGLVALNAASLGVARVRRRRRIRRPLVA
jgi:hypothetical protein